MGQATGPPPPPPTHTPPHLQRRPGPCTERGADLASFTAVHDPSAPSSPLLGRRHRGPGRRRDFPKTAKLWALRGHRLHPPAGSALLGGGWGSDGQEGKPGSRGSLARLPSLGTRVEMESGCSGQRPGRGYSPRGPPIRSGTSPRRVPRVRAPPRPPAPRALRGPLRARLAWARVPPRPSAAQPRPQPRPPRQAPPPVGYPGRTRERAPPPS